MDRKLAAILAADMVGFSRQMGADEAGTLARLTSLRSDILDPLLAEHHGRLFKTMGDGFLAEFGSAVQAVACALAIQARLGARAVGGLQLRIGIHQGDVVVQGEDLMGDGVNIAARLEALAEAGGICVSARVREDIAGKLEITADDIGPQSLKNIVAPIHAYRIRVPSATSATASQRPPDRPSIAVLAFTNMSGDPEQEYFADGIAEEIITGLARVRWLFVIARNSSFTYKGRAIDVRTVGRELGVRYVLEGSIRKGGGKVRITAQLIEAATGTHVWADRFDGDLEDVFALQDQVTESIVRAIAPTLRHAEIERAKRKPPESLDAYDLYLRTLPLFFLMTREGSDTGLQLIQRALEITPDYALALMVRGRLLTFRTAQGWPQPIDRHVAEVIDLAHRAVASDPNDPEVLAASAHGLAYLGGQWEVATQLVDRACQLGPNSAMVWSWSGIALFHAGLTERSLVAFDTAARLDPIDPMAFFTQIGRGFALMALGRYEEAVQAASQSARLNPNLALSWRVIAAGLALLGRLDEARVAAHKLLEREPDFSFAKFRRGTPSVAAGRFDQQIAGLRLVGIPEQ